MKVSFPKYGIDELLTQKRFATCIISFVALPVFTGVLGSYLVGNKFWLLVIAVLGIGGILLLLGARAAIFLNKSEVDEATSPSIEEYVPRITSQWDYRPKKPIRTRGVLDSPSTETSDGPSSDPFVINDNVWLNDNSLEGAVPTFIDGPPETEETKTEARPQTTDSVCSAPTIEDASVRRTTKVL